VFTGLLVTRNSKDEPARVQSVLACGIGSAIAYACLAIIISPLLALAWFFTGVAPVPEFVLVVLITSPIWFAFLGLLFGALAAFVYNTLIVAKAPTPRRKRKGTTPDSPSGGQAQAAG
jgi:hypothetical protein